MDLLPYLRGDTRPVGVTQEPGGDTIFQCELEPNSRRWWQKKGAFGVPAQWEELAYDDTYLYRFLDTSPADGSPYELRDVPAAPGSRWLKRDMVMGEVFKRTCYVLKREKSAGRLLSTSEPVTSWISFHQRYPTWRGVPDVVELVWYSDAALTQDNEHYFYGKGLGLIGFSGGGMSAYPNYVWRDKPPAPGVPVLERERLTWYAPAPLPLDTPPVEPPPTLPIVPPTDADVYAGVMSQIARIEQLQLALADIKSSLASIIGYE